MTVKDQNRKITSELFYLLYFGLMLIIGYRVLLMSEPVEQHADSLILFVIASVYVIIRTVWLGSAKGDLRDRKGFLFRNSIIAFAASILFVGFSAYTERSFDLMIALVEFFVFYLIFFGLIVVFQRLLFRRSPEEGTE
ncbi:DUF6773 family protein [Salisediminibacterium selenitireducens]|uniref:Uncharacterized protein n=1 Tax=Bacillus selenitireducens (strain ATCC 700615 / DSM 15326 / MLS10) TaxID=439292 RepID=D6XUR0_BACIE|nr:DUF6773 family protein [Salisediminibacterium selenitireducens]ADH99546.1 hypothetical protein Bsel_2042 [[Bacillus] selenitireducens MLS10]